MFHSLTGPDAMDINVFPTVVTSHSMNLLEELVENPQQGALYIS